MAINLLEMLQSQVGGELATQASKFLGESETNTTKAVGSILPTLMGSLLGKASNESGARGVLDFLKSNNIDGNILGTLGGLFGGGQSTDNLLNSGGGILKFLVGDKLGSIVDVISNVAGVKTGSSSSLLKMAAPLLMGFVGKYVKDKALDAIGLKNLLGGQKDFISKGIPSALNSVLGLSNLGGASTSSTTSKASSGGSSSMGTSGGGSNNLMKWLLPILGLALAGFLINKYGCNKTMDKASTAVTATADAAKAAADALAAETKRVADSIAATISKFTLPGGANLEVKKGSFTDLIASFFADTTKKVDPKAPMSFAFDGVNFKTGSDSLTMESSGQLNELASVLSAFASVNIKVEGHTDNVGNPAANKSLSDKRAKAVKAYLIGKSIAGARVATVGLGDTKPKVPNDSDANKAINRRVEVLVTKK